MYSSLGALPLPSGRAARGRAARASRARGVPRKLLFLVIE